MSISRFARWTLTTYAAVALLSGCGRSQPPTGASSAIAPTAPMAAPPGPGDSHRLTVLHRFRGYPNDGGSPAGSLTGHGDELYGVTVQGGTDYSGTIFAVSTTGKEHVLYNFKKKRDGLGPLAGPTYARGMLYGTTYYGGGNNGGTIYSMTPSGKERVLYSFNTTNNDGSGPDASLVVLHGVLYGTTHVGGTPGSLCNEGCGTVFSFNLASNRETVLHRFLGHADGDDPGQLIAAKGKLYGVTLAGGTNGCDESGGCGTVYKIDTSGKKHTLYTFNGGKDGTEPLSLVDVNGSIYGVTWEGGASRCSDGTTVVGCGTIFEIDASSTKHTVYSFKGQPDGALPNDLIDMNGTLYGATSSGGAKDHGTIFRVDASGKATTLFSFGEPHGKSPFGLLTIDGALYGIAGGGVRRCFATSFDSGPCGLVFRFEPR